MSTAPMRPCAFFHCPNGADPRWGGYCDGHGATTVDELTCRTSDENAVLRAEVERLKGLIQHARNLVHSNRVEWVSWLNDAPGAHFAADADTDADTEAFGEVE